MEHHAVPVAQALDVRGQVETDGSVADGVHRLSIKEVVGSGCKRKDTMSEESAGTNGGQEGNKSWDKNGILAPKAPK